MAVHRYCDDLCCNTPAHNYVGAQLRMATSSDVDGYTSSDAGASEESAPAQALNHAQWQRFQDREHGELDSWLSGWPKHSSDD